MPQLPVTQALLDYDVTGHGPGVVQLHGLTSSRARDAALLLDLSRRVEGHRVIRYDARGHGASSGDTEPASYTWGNLATDLLCLLDEESPGEPVHGVGQSMGAGTLLHAAVRRPERFSSLVLCIPPTAWASRVAQRAGYLATATLVEECGVSALMDLARTATRPPAVDPQIPVSPPTVPADLLPTVFRGAAESDLPSPEAISAIDVPALVLAWDEDPGHPLDTAHRLHDLLPTSRLVIAHSPDDVATWPELVAAHVAAVHGHPYAS
ncbi:MAG: alpha/beta fold hydrolase [Terracoccus sp.]